MNHFAEGAWLDFARQVIPPQQRTLMQRHLDQGCKKCQKLSEMWRAILDIASQEARYQVPERAIRYAKGAYGLQGPLQRLLRADKIARLIFDSFRQPAPAGVRMRGSTLVTRQLLYRAGDFLIDVGMESQGAGKHVFLVGQVLNSTTPEQGIKGAEVVLWRERRSVAQTSTNEFGEFHLEFPDEPKLRLVLKIPGHEAIRISLPGPERLRTQRRASS